MIAPRLAVLTLIASAAPALAAPASAPQPSPCPPRRIDLRDVMTVTQFDRAGLDKLSKEQLAALNQWFNQYLNTLCARANAGAPGAAAGGGQAPAQPAAAKSSEAAFGNPPARKHDAATDRIESRILGEFHGWTGDTVFRLANGQVWKQAGPGYFETDLKNPKVVIKKLLIGYVLLVDGYAKEVFVRRIR